MSHSLSDRLSGAMLRLGGWCAAVAVVASLGLPGCANLDFRGEQYDYDPMSEWGQGLRARDNQTDFFGLSNRAREIERHCGVE